MAASAAIAAFSMTFGVGDAASPEVFTALGEVITVTPPNIQIGSIDTTHHTSPSGVREFIAGLQDNGEVQVTLNYIPSTTASTAAVVIAALNRTKKNYKITYPNSKYHTFAAVYLGMSIDAPMDGKITATLRFKVSGVITAG